MPFRELVGGAKQKKKREKIRPNSGRDPSVKDSRKSLPKLLVPSDFECNLTNFGLFRVVARKPWNLTAESIFRVEKYFFSRKNIGLGFEMFR